MNTSPQVADGESVGVASRLHFPNALSLRLPPFQIFESDAEGQAPPPPRSSEVSHRVSGHGPVDL